MLGESPAPAPLADVTRGQIVESRHLGHGVVAGADGSLIAWFGDPARMTYLRSSGKPFQALPLIRSGAADAFGLDTREIALACSSHTGRPEHVAVGSSMLAKLGLTEQALRNPAELPDDSATAKRLLAGGIAPARLHQACSGKHLGMLACALHLGLDPGGYAHPDHPVQAAVAAALAGALDLPADSLPRGLDGCGAPTWVAPLRAIAAAYARLAAARGEGATALCRIRAAMLAHPELVHGPGGFDTVVMQAAEGDVVAKRGADGLRCFGIVSRSWGVAIRCEDGADRALDSVAPHLLAGVGAIDSEVAERIVTAFPATLHNWSGAVVGEILPRASWIWA